MAARLAPGQPRLRRWVPLAGGLLVVGILGTIVLLPAFLSLLAHQIPLPTGGEHEPAVPTARLPKEFARGAFTLEPEPITAPEPPIEQRAPAQPEHNTAPAPPEAPPAQASILPWPVSLGSPAAATGTKTASPAGPAGAGASTTKPEPPARKKWGIELKGGEEHAAAGTAPQDTAKPDSKALGLIQPATWAIPAYPLVTIYRSQTLIGRLAQAVNSDIPGQVKIELIMPLYDKFGKDQLILDKGTLIIASQEGKAQYGNTRLGLKLEQLELLTGEVVSFKAMVGDQEGANGVTGKVNNHYGKLLLATGLSAILNIGVRTATGTPNGFYQSPIQEASRDIGQDVQRSASSVIERELKIPPTIEMKAGTNVTINLAENITFSRKPVVIR